MNRVKLLLLSTCLLALSLGASSTLYADTVVAPNANTSTNANSFQVFPVGEAAGGTIQIGIAASQLTSIVGQDIDAIGFRLPGGASSVASVTLTGFSLELSGSANPIGSLSSTFASNIGANPLTVDSGMLTLTGLVGGTGPNPFFLINFSTPYLYTGGDLLITERYTSSSDSQLGVDANNPPNSIVDTVGAFSSSSTTGTAQFFNAPVTELVTTPAVPEPNSLMLLGTGIAGVAGMLRKRFFGK